MPWSEQAFRLRVIERCRELGLSQRAVLKAAQVAHDFLQVVPAHGRRVDSLEKIARALGWGLPEVMGMDLRGQVDAGLMRDALEILRKATRYLHQDEISPAIEADLLTTIYNILDDFRADGTVIDQTLKDQIARTLAKRETTARGAPAAPRR